MSCIVLIVRKIIIIVLIVFQKTNNTIVMVLNLSRKLAQQSIRNFTHTTWVSGMYPRLVILSSSFSMLMILFRSSSYPHLLR